MIEVGGVTGVGGRTIEGGTTTERLERNTIASSLDDGSLSISSRSSFLGFTTSFSTSRKAAAHSFCSNAREIPLSKKLADMLTWALTLDQAVESEYRSLKHRHVGDLSRLDLL